jgi:hypothetical protein
MKWFVLQGTVPFMAVRLLKEWLDLKKSSDPKFTHTPIDDLENFLWVLIWVPLERHRRQNDKLPLLADRLWSCLNSANILLQSAKFDIIRDIEDNLEDEMGLGPITPFILDWGDLARKGHVQYRRNCAKTIDFYKKFYEQYLDAGFSHLNQMPDTGVVGGNRKLKKGPPRNSQ